MTTTPATPPKVDSTELVDYLLQIAINATHNASSLKDDNFNRPTIRAYEAEANLARHIVDAINNNTFTPATTDAPLTPLEQATLNREAPNTLAHMYLQDLQAAHVDASLAQQKLVTEINQHAKTKKAIEKLITPTSTMVTAHGNVYADLMKAAEANQ